MIDVFTLSRYAQRDIEQLFAVTCINFPLYSVQKAGWLPSSELVDPIAARFWEALKVGITMTMDDEQANCVVTQALISSGFLGSISPEIKSTVDMLEPMPQELAREIARRHYITAVASRLGGLYTAVRDADDGEISRIVSEIAANSPTGFDTSCSATDMHKSFAGIVASFGKRRSISTSILPIDKQLGGLERQTLTLIAGRPSMGKTALAWQIARNAALANNKVIVFSLEMSSASLWARAACPRAGVSWIEARSGRLTEQQSNDLISVSDKLASEFCDNLRIDDRPQTSETIWQACATSMPDIVVIDHLRLLKDKGDNENKRQGAIVQNLKDMAKALNCVVICAVQLNRGVEDRKEKIPMLSDLRDSGEIEEVGDVIMMLYRPDYYDPPVVQTNRHYTEVWVRKNRDGVQNGLIKLIYDTWSQTFEMMDERRPY